MKGPFRFRDANNKVVFENIVALAILQVVIYLLPALMLYYLTEVVGMVLLSRIAFANAFAQIGVAVVDFGYKLTATRDVAANRADPERLSRIFSTVMAVKALLAVGVMLVALLLIALVPTFRENAWLIVFSFGAVIGDVLIPVWFFQGMEKMKFMTVLNSLTHVVFFALVLLLIKDPSHYEYVPLLASAGYLVSGVVCMTVVMRRFPVRLHAVTWGAMWASARDTWRVFVTNFLPNLYNDGVELILQLITGNQSPVLGYFSLAKKVIDVFNSVIYVIARAYFPLLTRAASYFRGFRNVMLAWGLGLSAVAMLAAPWVSGIASQDQWAGALPLILILGVSPFCLAVLLAYGRNFLLMHRLDDLYLRVVLVVSLLGLALGVVLVPLFEQYGAAATLAGSRVVYAALSYALAMRLVRQGRVRADGTLPEGALDAGGLPPWRNG